MPASGLLDEQGLQGALLFPTLGVGMQEALRHDPEAMHAAFEAFNRWLDDDWGFDRGDGRLYGAPMITFADPALAAAEVERVLTAGARIMVMVPGPIPDGNGYVSPGHPKFDPVWSLFNDSGVPLALHAGLSGVNAYGKLWATGAKGASAGFEGFKHAAFPLVTFADRSISDTLSAILCHGVFDRYPNVRIASIENGAMWVPDLLRNLRAGHGKMPFAFGTDPVERLRSNVWVAPYYEDDMDLLREEIGIDRLLFGSDFPHAEGLVDPLFYVKDIPTFDAEATRKVMRDNVLELIAPRPPESTTARYSSTRGDRQTWIRSAVDQEVSPLVRNTWLSPGPSSALSEMPVRPVGSGRHSTSDDTGAPEFHDSLGGPGLDGSASAGRPTVVKVSG